MTVDDAIKAALLLAGLASAGGVGSYFGGEDVSDAAVEGWCGSALAIQAEHYHEQVEECEDALDVCEEEEE